MTGPGDTTAAAAAAATAGDESDLDSYDRLVGKMSDLPQGSLIVLEFKATWCGMCHKIEPEIQVSEYFLRSGKMVHFVLHFFLSATR